MMPWVLAALGRAQKFEAMRRGFTSKSEPGSDVWSGMILMVALGVVVIGVLLVLNRVQLGKKARETASAHTLFREVLQKLSLGIQDRTLLRRVAQEMKLENPAVMLLTPQVFADVAHSYVAVKPGKSRSDMTRLAAICQQLFGQKMPQPQPAKPAETGPPSPPKRPEH